MIVYAGSIILASLLGSPHCAGMCGGFVCFYTGDDVHPNRAGVLPHAAYNGGRLVSYLTLGALAGTGGAAVDGAAGFAGVGRAAAIVAGLLMITWGGSLLGRTFGLRIPHLRPPQQMQAALGNVLRRMRSKTPVARALAIGLVTTLLPCGWLYAFVAAAAGTGSPLKGAGLMACFWIGTLPVMVGLGLGMQRLFGRLRHRLPLITATAVIIIGFLTVVGRLEPTPFSHHGVHVSR